MNNKKLIDQIDLKDKKVIIRLDLNVPMKDGKITNNKRIVSALPTIKKAYESGAKVILLSHLGRVKEESDKATKTLKPIAKELTKLLDGKEVIFVPEAVGKEVKEVVKAMKSGEIVLLENTRWEDLNNKAESTNNPKLAKYWASLGEVFINDAFGTSHRSHASNVGIASNIAESGIGYLVQKEIEMLSKAINHPAKPAVAIIGGAKVSDKIKTIDNLLKHVDRVIIGGGMAFTFWKAQGLSVGKSLVELDQVELAKEYLKKYQDRLILPIDAALSVEFKNSKPIYNIYNPLEIPENYMGLDIGPKSIQLFKKELADAKTVIWNGPLGVCEFKNYSVGTQEIAKAIGSLKDAYTVVGGGDSVAAIATLGLESEFSHISTGGGACLAMLEGNDLPGISAIQNQGEKSRIAAEMLNPAEVKIDVDNNKKNEESTKELNVNKEDKKEDEQAKTQTIDSDKSDNSDKKEEKDKEDSSNKENDSKEQKTEVIDGK
ncbi:MAG: phosphoglycerate kinase [Mycoplasmataceae bacterium]|nr:phosphoglycerate kinase [Mycoplasmataceae bacterium]